MHFVPTSICFASLSFVFANSQYLIYLNCELYKEGVHIIKSSDILGYFQGLLTHHSHLSYVVPDICLLFIIGHQGQSPLK